MVSVTVFAESRRMVAELTTLIASSQSRWLVWSLHMLFKQAIHA